MRRREREIEALGLRVAVVTFDSADMARRYRAHQSLTWPLLLDEGRELYRAFGLSKASLADLWGPRTWIGAVRSLLRGVRPGKPGRDIHQRGGDVLVDPAGIVRLHFVGRGPADRPEVERLLAIVRSAPFASASGGPSPSAPEDLDRPPAHG